jgi:D-glycerate 3-kinase
MSSCLEILKCCTHYKKYTEDEVQQLSAVELNTAQRAQAFDVNSSNCQQKLEQRLQILLDVYPDVLELCGGFGFQDSDYLLNTLWTLWLPLTIQLTSQKQELGRTLVQGILGGQGTGKTTLAAVIKLLAKYFGYSSVAISIDDLYKTYAERQQLQQQDPRLIWRGPPGTHDLELGIKVLEQLRRSNFQAPVVIPRFDKSLHNGAGDRCEPDLVDSVDLVLFEGWFVGARPIESSLFENAPSPIVTPEDRLFALDTNKRLAEYLPLWNQLDRLLVLYPVDYRLSKQWRKEAEHKMIAQGKEGMSDEEIDRFVEYFWRSLHPELFIKPLISNANFVDLIVEINPDHSPGRVYLPSGEGTGNRQQATV